MCCWKDRFFYFASTEMWCYSRHFTDLAKQRLETIKLSLISSSVLQNVDWNNPDNNWKHPCLSIVFKNVDWNCSHIIHTSYTHFTVQYSRCTVHCTHSPLRAPVSPGSLRSADVCLTTTTPGSGAPPSASPSPPPSPPSSWRTSCWAP